MRKDERGASTRPDARMTCEGDTSNISKDTQRDLYDLARGSTP